MSSSKQLGAQGGSEGDKFSLTEPISRDDFKNILEMARLITAHLHHNFPCIDRQQNLLRARGETSERLQALLRWRTSKLLSRREKAALGLSESISLDGPESIQVALGEARRHFSIEETIRLSLGIVAINDWIEINSKPHIRVLVVEDNSNDQELLRHQLNKINMEENVIFVPDARKGITLLERYQQKFYDWELMAVFLDIHLPDMNGVELLKQIRYTLKLADLPVIMMTSSNNPRDIEECRCLGVECYVQKPVTSHSFSQAVASIFHRPITLKAVQP
jgi:CheY-like chemotaxis protein